MNAEQRKIVIEMQDGTAPPINIVSAANAKALVEGGYARYAKVSPAPKDGKAINLTARGRGVGPKADETPAAAPTVSKE